MFALNEQNPEDYGNCVGNRATGKKLLELVRPRDETVVDA